MTFLSKEAPDILTHTEIDPSDSLTEKDGCANSTCTSVRGPKRGIKLDESRDTVKFQLGPL